MPHFYVHQIVISITHKSRFPPFLRGHSQNITATGTGVYFTCYVKQITKSNLLEIKG